MEYEGVHRSIDLNTLKKNLIKIEKEYALIDSTENFNWSLVPKL